MLLHPAKRLGDGALCQNRSALSPTHIVGILYPYLREVDTEGVHIQSVEETSEALTKARQALMHKLEVHHVGFEIGHGV